MEMEDEYLDRGYYRGDDGDPGYRDYPDDYVPDDEYANYDPYDPYYDDDMYYTKISSNELLDRCVIPTISQACETVMPLLGMCFVSRVTNYFVAEG